MNKKENYIGLFLICIVLLLVFSFAHWGTYDPDKLTDTPTTKKLTLKDLMGDSAPTESIFDNPKPILTNYTGWKGSAELFNIRIYNWHAVVSSLLLCCFAIINLKKPLKVLEIFCIILGAFSIYHLSVWLYFKISDEKNIIGIGVIITLIITIVALVFTIKSAQLLKNNPEQPSP